MKAEQQDQPEDSIVAVPAVGRKFEPAVGPAITTISSGYDDDTSHENNKNKKKVDGCIVSTACVYTFFVILMLTLPFAVVNRDGSGSDNGLEDFFQVLGVLILTSGCAVITSIVSLCLLCCKPWKTLSTCSKVLVLYPIILNLIVLLVMVIIGRVNNKGHHYYEPPCVQYAQDGITCIETIAPKINPTDEDPVTRFLLRGS